MHGHGTAERQARGAAVRRRDRRHACHLADIAGPQSWNTQATEDVLEAIDTLAGALSVLGPDTAHALAPVLAATADARRHLGLANGEERTTAQERAAPRTTRRTRRRGLGPGSPACTWTG
ncbi:hypothetical protein SBD_2074 [Streptomyces bottropensis ATCC 25435]|uniref:Uncharacterized protein n=1 Tax=Streptomyces bottropensis ATCC 25435 TaxID=1054862 RepID=M3DIA0_9ACTN|nr:hypothetical protein SBD_2074 [Streptomyces bottropensis ATCC 25435]